MRRPLDRTGDRIGGRTDVWLLRWRFLRGWLWWELLLRRDRSRRARLDRRDRLIGVNRRRLLRLGRVVEAL
ncbi:MAG: hypothetical protein ACE5GX_11615 [Thermoanaerobaculia bacterium]